MSSTNNAAAAIAISLAGEQRFKLGPRGLVPGFLECGNRLGHQVFIAVGFGEFS